MHFNVDFGYNLTFYLRLRKNTENLDSVSWSQDLPDAGWLLAFKYANPNAVPSAY
jgi:hypothetical protein